MITTELHLDHEIRCEGPFAAEASTVTIPAFGVVLKSTSLLERTTSPHTFRSVS